jgi:predicted nucleotidyltransferase
MQHQEDTLAAYVDKVAADETAIAVVLVGSLAKGTERVDSDVDVYLIVTDAAFAEAEAREQLSYVDSAIATYEGGYVDIKLATVDYLRRAATEGDDPVRASFLRARVAWSRDTQLAALVAAIPALPDEAWADRTASFIAQMRLYGGYFLKQGQQLGDEYLLRWAALHTVSSAGRALLARGHVLFSGNKYLSSLLAGLPDLPRGYLQLAEQLLVEPTAETGTTFLALVEAHHDWPIAREQTLSRFVRENELSWLTRVPPPEFR